MYFLLKSFGPALSKYMSLSFTSKSQILRFGIVGVSSNIVIYALYLLLTSFGVGHISAMTLLFVLGVIQTFILNKQWTFTHQDIFQTSFLKYVAVYSFAYLLNLFALLVLVDKFGYPHQAVQGATILCLAIMLFFLLKYWVFRIPCTTMKRKIPDEDSFQ